MTARLRSEVPSSGELTSSDSDEDGVPQKIARKFFQGLTLAFYRSPVSPS